MPSRSLFLGALLGGVIASAEPPTTIPLKSENIHNPQLPLTIPGYQLRVLATPKPVTLSIGGERVEVSVPIFFYYPDPASPDAKALLHQACDDLAAFGKKEQWTAAELQQVLSTLDKALSLIDPPAPPSSLANSVPQPGGPSSPALPKIIPLAPP